MLTDGGGDMGGDVWYADAANPASGRARQDRGTACGRRWACGAGRRVAYALPRLGLDLGPASAAWSADRVAVRLAGYDRLRGGRDRRCCQRRRMALPRRHGRRRSECPCARRRGPADRVRAPFVRRQIRRGRWISNDVVVVGQDTRGRLVRVPTGGASPSHGLVCGATGSGKTVSMVLIARAAIERGFGVIVVDPKPDDFMFEQLRHAARRAGRRFVLWTPDGDAVYNPYGYGFDTEIADKLLATETFTEPHYERLARRYLGHAVRALRGAGVTVSLATVLEVVRPAGLASLARDLPPDKAAALLDYLESLTSQQERDLAGARDRLAILAETDMCSWLDPRTHGEAIDLRGALDRGDVVMFRLDADRRSLATGMLAAAIVQDLVAISAGRQSGDHRPGLIVIDEFSAIAAKEVVRHSAGRVERSSACFSGPRSSPISRPSLRAQQRWAGSATRSWATSTHSLRTGKSCPNRPSCLPRSLARAVHGSPHSRLVAGWAR